MLHVNYCGLCKITLARHILKNDHNFFLFVTHIKKVVYGNQTANPKTENGPTADIVHGTSIIHTIILSAWF